MSVSLYRKYRPQDFASVVGQKPAIDVLTNAITKHRVGHAYLFSGSRGCGKTSIARIFAKALNCLEPNGYEPCGHCANCEAITAGESLDVIEIDGASNRGIENVRGLRENVTLAPFSSRYKIYIIDEVHMFTSEAFNALLKTLEEPPEHAVFILATTEPHKVPVTIRSRCQHIPFHSISPEDISSRLSYVCSAEGLNADTEALWEIARQAEGALRDALSLLEQVIASGDVTLANVEAVIGAGSRPTFERWLRTLRTDKEQAYLGLKAMFDAGASGERVFEEIFSLVRNLWLVSKWRGISDGLGLSEAEKRFLQDEAQHWKPGELHTLLNHTLTAMTKAKQRTRNDILLGMFMLSLETLDAPSNTPPMTTPRPQTQQPAPAPKPTPIKQAVPPSYDPALKQEVLALTHEASFTLYCALFDVDAYIGEGMLILDVKHPYCFDRLRLDVNTSLLAHLLEPKFGRIAIRYGAEVKVCIPHPNLLDPPQNQKAPKAQPTRKSAEPYSPPATEQQEVLTSPPDPLSLPSEGESARTRREASVFNEYIRALTMMGAAPDVILIKHNDEAQDNTDDLPQEGDNDE